MLDSRSIPSAPFINSPDLTDKVNARDVRQAPLVLEVDLTSGTLRFTDPAQLENLVRIARSILFWKKGDVYGTWPSPATEGDIQIFDAIANITLPSDEV